MDLTTLQQLKPVTLQLDWRAYWERFKEVHGDPVRHKGVLLFADGWTYSATDMEGPEWEPPHDAEELRRLRLAYYKTRRNRVNSEALYWKQVVDWLETQQAGRHIPIQRSEMVSYEDEGGARRYRTEAQDVSIDDIKLGRLAWLEQDVRECDAMIEQLSDAVV